MKNIIIYCIIALVLLSITGCLPSKQKIMILDDGSILYTCEIFAPLEISKETNDNQLHLLRLKRENDLMKLLTLKYKNISGVEFADAYTSNAIYKDSNYLKYQIEIKVKNIDIFNETIKKIRDTHVTTFEIYKACVENGLQPRKNGINRECLKPETTTETNQFYTNQLIKNMKIAHKFDSIYYFEIIFESVYANGDGTGDGDIDLQFIANNIISSNATKIEQSDNNDKVQWLIPFPIKNISEYKCRADFDVGSLSFYKAKAKGFIENIKKKFE
jgi:hypothetical protein